MDEELLELDPKLTSIFYQRLAISDGKYRKKLVSILSTVSILFLVVLCKVAIQKGG